eukprot:CAMPEP_0118704808 /NCGR_PEP_ID=MMETSP0800-20121206/19472_1 /TAXON_ID=210618 ORGANISM="Striatella unipunctata, Strain CCMP2910" /NCGR_SAMPLE_ID=MMETSP0800 /ASSEMBLY_ACC=CAM_ASM_000638 /LENGTH=166 /DNA_ID=CAMNT_0006606801 /DNA_START=75 /DNA_END=575 /DNA_ORIENTATION=+
MPPPKSAVQGGRKKQNLKKGFGLHDWNLLVKSAKDLAQRRGKGMRNISMEEIAKHNKVHDAWIALHGKVYNVSPYLEYHPGGSAIMVGVLGKDATPLFDRYHRWVNADGLIGVLQLGYVDHKPNNGIQRGNDGFAIPAARPPRQIVPSLLGQDEDDEDEDMDLLQS